MFKTLYNQAKLLFRIDPVGPLLIKTGQESFDPTRPAMEFVRTKTLYGEVPYIPGSSLKGVVRSHAERLLRTLQVNYSCDITEKGCPPEEGDHYRNHCYACRTFGSTKIASRTRITDAYPWKVGASQEEVEEIVTKIDERIPIELRTNVKIDRRKGTAAGGGPFECEVVTGGSFYGELTIRNYQLWQIALLALVLRDINDGYQKLGAGKSRGFGWVRVSVQEFEFQQWGVLANGGGELRGIGWPQNGIVERYDLIGSDSIVTPDSVRTDPESSKAGIVDVLKPANEAERNWQELSDQFVASANWQSLCDRSKKQ